MTPSRTLPALILMVLGCGDGPAPPGPVPDPVGTLRWGTTEFGDLRVSLPEIFAERWDRHATEVHYLGPAIDGFRVQFQVIWMASDMLLDRWADIRLSKVRADPFKELLGEGSARVGPWPARTVVYRWIDSEQRPVTNIDYYFTGAGHVGMLRGVAPTPQFLTYRPVFDAIASRLAYRSASSSER